VDLNVAVATGAGQAPLDLLSYILGVVLTLPILWRRRWPFGVLLACSALLFAYYSLHRRNISPVPLLAFPLYDAATAGYLAWAIAIPAGYMAIGLVLVYVTTKQGIATIAYNFLPSIALLAVAVALGDTVKSRRALAVETAEKLRIAEEERIAEALRAVAEERLRIARDLHDTVAHAMATITVLAGTALHLAEAGPRGNASKHGPDQAATENPVGTITGTLTSIRQTSKSALTDMRATLNTLRAADADEQTRSAGLDRLEELIGAVRAAGAPVTLSIDGERRPVPQPVDHAAYRILQESLTNVLRHAGSQAKATVAICYATDDLSILVSDDGNGAAAGSADGGGSGPGHGLTGMTERAAAVGGDVSAGPRAGGGFEVRARLPIGAAGLRRDPGGRPPGATP
jgi:signal transduction histidine kinase